MGDGLEVGVEDAALGVEGLAVAVGGGGGVEALGEFELGLWRDVGLVLEDDHLVGEEGGADHVKVGVCGGGVESARLMGRGWLRMWVSYLGGYRLHGYSPFSSHSIISFIFFHSSCQAYLTTEILNVNARDGRSEIEPGSLRDRKGGDRG